MAEYVTLPDGSLFPRNEGESYGEAIRVAYAKYPQAFGQAAAPEPAKKAGYLADIERGMRSMLSSERTGLASLVGGTEAAKEGLKRQQAISEEYAPSAGWEEVKKAYAEKGLLPAVGEYISQVPHAMAEQAPQIAQSVAGMVAGEAAMPAGGGIFGAFAPSFLQQYGGFLEQQAQEQQEKGQPVDVSRFKAAAAAVPAAMIDVAEMYIPMGKGVVKSLFPAAEKMLAKGATKEAEALVARKLANESFLKTAAIGTAKGAALEPTGEVLQDMIGRLQAGQPLFSDDAVAGYGQTAYRTMQMGPFGALGRLQEKAEARATVAKQDEEDARKAAAEAEAAKGTPQALSELHSNFLTAKQQLDDLNQQVNAAKPKKGATDEQRETYQTLKTQRDGFVNETFKPLAQEYAKRKPAIDQMLAQQQMEMETAGAATQPTASRALPSDVGQFTLSKEGVPEALPYQLTPITHLMNQHDTLRAKLASLQEQYTQGADIPTQRKLEQQMADTQSQLQEMGKTIEYQGGTTDTAEEHAKKLKTAEKARLDAMAKGDIAAAQKHAATVEALNNKTPYLEELADWRVNKGKTRELFPEMPEQPEPTETKYVKPSGEEFVFPDVAQSMAEAFELPQAKPTLREKQATAAGEKLVEAQNNLASAVKSGNQVMIDAALKEVNKYETQQSRLSQPAQKGTTLDIFDPSNILREAIANNDWATALGYTKARDESKAKDLETATKEREKLIKVLDERLGLGGEELATTETGEQGQPLRSVERTQNNFSGIANAVSSLYPNQKGDHWSKYLLNSERLLRTGEFPDAVIQEKYNASPEAFAHDFVMNRIEDLKKKVEQRQGNEKVSKLQRILDLAKEEQELVDRLTTGIAKPTMREKAAQLNAKLGKGPEVGERQMDAAERRAAEKRLDKVREEYADMLKKIEPVKNDIVRLYNTLYKQQPLKTVKAAQEAKAKLSSAPGEAARAKMLAAVEKYKTAQAFNDPEAIAAARKEMRQASLLSREAKRAKRINEGDVAYEASKSEEMDQLAYKLGVHTEGFLDTISDLHDRLEKLQARYGKDDERVREFRADSREQLVWKAIAEGRKTAEYKAAKKEQLERVRGALAQGVQEVPSKRTGTITRRVSQAAKHERTGSPESRAATEARQESASKRSTPSQVTAAMRGESRTAANKANKTDGGTAYKLGEEVKEGETKTVVDAQEAQKVVDGLKLPENVKFVYAPTPGKIPVRLLNMMAEEGVDPTEAMVKGAVFGDGTVLVVGDQHATVQDLEETIAHELIGHYGVDTIIGHDRLNAFAKKTDIIDLAQKIGGDKLVREVLQTVQANARLGRSEEVQKLQGLREIIAHTAEARITESFREKAGRWLKELVGMLREGLRGMGFKHLGELSTSDVFYMLKRSDQAFKNKTIGPYKTADGDTAFRLRRQPSRYTSVGTEPGIVDKFLGNVMGLAGRVQFVDQYAALEEAIKQGKSAGEISSLEATNINYLLRFGQQRSQYAGQFMLHGPVKVTHTKKAGGVETLYSSVKGTTLGDVASALHEAGIANETEQEHMFTLYLAGQRANQVGWEKLNFSDPAKSKAEYADVMQRLDGDTKAKSAFEKAAKLYKEYNAGLLDFLVDTGALTAQKAAELKNIAYVPFYRINDNGDVQLMIDKEHPVRIANIKDEPQLKELVGGNTAIMPVFTSAAQNTFMITGMGLRNQAVKETAFALQKIGIASAVREGKGPSSPDVVRFKKNGKDYYAMIDTDAYGIPAELIVRGMEGIKTTLPAVIKLMGVPANILRSFVVKNPAYALRQVVRDPLNAWMTTGTDATPVLSSMKELAKMVAGRSATENKLMASGAISSNIYAGDERDMAKFVKEIASGRSGWDRLLGRLDTLALQGDAATRAVVYQDSIKKGMSEQEALLRTLEATNFSRRGVSPSMHALSVMIPFFNAQIQGLDVLYRAFKGDMPYSDQLKIREKMIQRGVMMAFGTLAYAAYMQDDEAYKRAKPEERYANWFVYLPGISEPVRVPIPFEMGFLFKALPEAIWDMAATDTRSEKAMGGLFKLAQQNNPFSLPQAIKPLTEVVLGKSFYGGDIESAREKEQLATSRSRANTTELAKMIGSVTGHIGVSPIAIDYLIRGYTSGLGIALIQLADPILAPSQKDMVATPSLKPSQLPVIGSLFQPTEGRGTLDEAYDRMQEIKQVKGTYTKLIEEGKRAEAEEFKHQYINELSAVSVSGAAYKRLGEIAKRERMVKADPKMTQAQKDVELERLDKMKIAYARNYLAQSYKTKSQ